MSGIFISYRRDDSQAVAARLADRLTQRFGKDRVYRDVDSSEPGSKFTQLIGERIAGCDALVALIGRRWLEVRNAEGTLRLDEPHDLVRVEIAAALTQNKLVIPVLIEGEPMPARADLPAEIASLADRNALPMSDSRFDFDVGVLISAIEKVISPDWQMTPAKIAKEGAPRWTYIAGSIIAMCGLAWAIISHFIPNAEPQRAPQVPAVVQDAKADGGIAITATGNSNVTVGGPSSTAAASSAGLTAPIAASQSAIAASGGTAVTAADSARVQVIKQP